MAITLSTTQGPTGGGNPVIISGFSGNATTVKFGTKNITISPAAPSPITVAAPAGGGVVSVAVVSSAGTSNSVPYYYIGAPYVGSLYPTSGPVAGGTPVTFSGVGLVTTSTTSGVTFGGTSGTSIVVPSDNTVTATTPANPAGDASIRVITAGGAFDDMLFTYLPAPVFTSISPNTGSIAGGDSVTIKGSNLGTTTSITIGGAEVATFTIADDSTLNATTPPGTAGAVDVVINAAGGDSGTSGAGAFTYF